MTDFNDIYCRFFFTTSVRGTVLRIRLVKYHIHCKSTPGRDTPNNNNNNASTSESRNRHRHTIDGNAREWRPRDWRAAKPRVTRNDTPWATTSEDTEDNWCVVNRRSTARHSMGQCAQCGETNHVTARCRHRDKVQCRVCGNRGHKEKHHTEQKYH